MTPSKGWLQATMTIERDGVEKEVTVWGLPSKGHKAVHTLPNGDPGYPEEPPEMDVDADALYVTPTGYVEHIEMSDLEMIEAEEKLWEEASESL